MADITTAAAEVQARAERRRKARALINAMCRGDKWVMSIPVQRDDSDVLLSDVLADSDWLEQELSRLVGRAHRAIEAVERLAVYGSRTSPVVDRRDLMLAVLALRTNTEWLIRHEVASAPAPRDSQPGARGTLMSWGRSASGTTAEVKEQVQGWEKSVVDADRSYNATEDLVGLHKEQARKCADAVTAFADAAPEGYVVNASGGGHAGVSTTGEVTADQWNVSISTYKPAPVVAGG